MATMSKRKRIQSALEGKQVDRVPVAFWRHWPEDDQREDSLVQVTLDFQRKYDLDFIKFPVSSTSCVADFGIKHAYQGNLNGDRDYLKRVIETVDDWDTIQPLPADKGTYGWLLRALRRVAREKEADTPLVVTIFNPLSMAFYLAGDETCLAHLRNQPERVERAIQALTETCSCFVRAAISAGADGIFLSTRLASYDMMNDQEYNRFGRPGDLEVIEAASRGWFNILHAHGRYPMLALLSDYPVQALNWHDRTTSTNLSDGAAIFGGAVLGGVEQYKLLQYGSPNDVQAQVRNAIKQMRGRRIIIGPGCTYPLSIPHANLAAVRRAVETAH